MHQGSSRRPGLHRSSNDDRRCELRLPFPAFLKLLVECARGVVPAIHPASYRLVGDRDTEFGQQILDVTEAQRESKVQPNSLLDHLRRKPVATVADFRHPGGLWSRGQIRKAPRRDRAGETCRQTFLGFENDLRTRDSCFTPWCIFCNRLTSILEREQSSRQVLGKRYCKRRGGQH